MLLLVWHKLQVKKACTPFCRLTMIIIQETGFEPAASATPGRCSTKLSYSCNHLQFVFTISSHPLELCYIIISSRTPLTNQKYAGLEPTPSADLAASPPGQLLLQMFKAYERFELPLSGIKPVSYPLDE